MHLTIAVSALYSSGFLTLTTPQIIKEVTTSHSKMSTETEEYINKALEMVDIIGSHH